MVETMTFETWSMEIPPEGLRAGQHLFNTAPEHIQSFTRGVMELDPFHVDSISTLYILNNFLLFANLVWEIRDHDEMEEAFKLVMAEPNARRR